MFPLYDSSPRESFPFINYLLILANIFVFYLQLMAPDFEQFTYNYAFIPSAFEILKPESYIFILTSMFLHGGFLHILSNLWFLHIFGDNIEDRMGHIPYLLFYLASGFIATFGQYIFMPSNLIPLVGASGAISGVAGAYFILYRHSRIKALVPLGFYITTANLPVWFFLGYWFVIQIFSSLSSVNLVAGDGGVAWFAHIAGFVFGWIIAALIGQKHKLE